MIGCTALEVLKRLVNNIITCVALFLETRSKIFQGRLKYMRDKTKLPENSFKLICIILLINIIQIKNR